jgi:hypothetical protein
MPDPSRLARESEAYQAMLEGVRAHPDDDELQEDFERAKRAVDVAWIEHHTRMGDAA